MEAYRVSSDFLMFCMHCHDVTLVGDSSGAIYPERLQYADEGHVAATGKIADRG